MKNISQYISLFALAIGVLACNTDKTTPGYTFMDDMYVGPALETYSQTDEFGNNMAAQKPVEGTVPRNYTVYEFENTTEGYDLAKVELQMPDEFKGEESLKEGKELYGIFCSNCHGDKGDGQGHLVKIEKFPPVPGYDTRDLTAGSIYHVIMYGRGLMGSHASQLNNEERWKIVRYVQELRGDKVTTANATDTEVSEVVAEEEAKDQQS